MTNFSYTFPTDEVDPTPGEMKFINWNRCSERMPPDDDDTWIIIKDEHKPRIRRGWIFNSFYSGINCEWIPYDEATWRKLNEQIE